MQTCWLLYAYMITCRICILIAHFFKTNSTVGIPTIPLRHRLTTWQLVQAAMEKTDDGVIKVFDVNTLTVPADKTPDQAVQAPIEEASVDRNQIIKGMQQLTVDQISQGVIRGLKNNQHQQYGPDS